MMAVAEQTLPIEGEGDIRQPVPGKCTSPKADGSPCTRDPQPGKNVCWSHDPQNAEHRKRNSSAGGKAVMSLISEKTSVQREELAGLKEELRKLARDVRAGDVTAQVGSTLVQVYNVLLRTIDQDRKVRELDEVEERLAALEGEAS